MAVDHARDDRRAGRVDDLHARVRDRARRRPAGSSGSGPPPPGRTPPAGGLRARRRARRRGRGARVKACGPPAHLRPTLVHASLAHLRRSSRPRRSARTSGGCCNERPSKNARASGSPARRGRWVSPEPRPRAAPCRVRGRRRSRRPLRPRPPPVLGRDAEHVDVAVRRDRAPVRVAAVDGHGHGRSLLAAPERLHDLWRHAEAGCRPALELERRLKSHARQSTDAASSRQERICT